MYMYIYIYISSCVRTKFEKRFYRREPIAQAGLERWPRYFNRSGTAA